MLNKFSIFGKTKASEGDVSGRAPLPSSLARDLGEQFSYLNASEIAGFTYEKHRSERADARNDLSIYDGTGALRFKGRMFDARNASFWKP